MQNIFTMLVSISVAILVACPTSAQKLPAGGLVGPIIHPNNNDIHPTYVPSKLVTAAGNMCVYMDKDIYGSGEKQAKVFKCWDDPAFRFQRGRIGGSGYRIYYHDADAGMDMCLNVDDSGGADFVDCSEASTLHLGEVQVTQGFMLQFYPQTVGIVVQPRCLYARPVFWHKGIDGGEIMMGPSFNTGLPNKNMRLAIPNGEQLIFTDCTEKPGKVFRWVDFP